MRAPQPVAVDFETEGSEERPDYPPKPVSVSLVVPGGQPEFLSWGHPLGNNCTKDFAVRRLKRVWGGPLVFHHSKFDVDVAQTHLGLPLPRPGMCHDTLFLAFLHDPHSRNLGLKPLAERHLGMPATERDALREWVLEHVGGARKSDWGKHIAKAPGKVVEPYAKGDSRRTLPLFKFLWADVARRGMLPAYERERMLMPVLLRGEREGIRVKTAKLRRDVLRYGGRPSPEDGVYRGGVIGELDGRIRKRLRAPGLDVDSGRELAAALDKAGVMKSWRKTPTGKLSIAKESLLEGLGDRRLLAVMLYRGALATCVRTFMAPWLETAERTGGTIHTNWNQVRQSHSAGGEADAGARTGRLSSNPNFQNIPTSTSPNYEKLVAALKRAKLFDELAPFPMVRSYLAPDGPGEVFINRDYCFSADTEVLTDQGWKFFPDLSRTERVAQWRDGVVSFARPLAWQALDYAGPMYRISGARSTDLLVSENHRCLVELTGAVQKFAFVKPEEYPIGHARQYHAGVLPGRANCAKAELILVVAVQADARIQGRRADFYLKKPRKVRRLLAALRDLKVTHTLNRRCASKPGFTRVSFEWSCVSRWLRVEDGKIFDRAALRALQPKLRRFFLEELGYWDGSIKAPGRNWYYASACALNSEIVSELAAVTGLRSVVNKRTLPSGKKFVQVSLRAQAWTGTDRYTIKRQRCQGKVYCVTMPWSTVIVRRRGKTCVTGQSQQELRILGHYEDDVLRDQYNADPWLDVHNLAQKLINEMLGSDFNRRAIKDTGFGLIYGMGKDKLAAKIGETSEVAKQVKRAYLRIFPGLEALDEGLKASAAAGEAIRTWGGREYHVEPPAFVKKFNRVQTFEYKLLNQLVQGSAADNTKQAILNYDSHPKRRARFLLTVHDEFLASCRKEALAEQMAVLKESMEAVRFDVPMLSEGEWGTDWADLKAFDAKGKELYRAR